MGTTVPVLGRLPASWNGTKHSREVPTAHAPTPTPPRGYWGHHMHTSSRPHSPENIILPCGAGLQQRCSPPPSPACSGPPPVPQSRSCWSPAPSHLSPPPARCGEPARGEERREGREGSPSYCCYLSSRQHLPQGLEQTLPTRSREAPGEARSISAAGTPGCAIPDTLDDV